MLFVYFQKLPNFLIASDLSAHVSPVVILPPHTDTPENETIDMNLVDTTVPKSCVSINILLYSKFLGCCQMYMQK